MKWNEIKTKTMAAVESSGLPEEYRKRLEFEFREIEKQATQEYWEDAVKVKKTFAKNKNGLVLPWILGMTKIDPIEGEKVIYAGDGNIEMDGIEIEIENGKRIPISPRTMVRTQRGLVSAENLIEGDILT